MILDGGPCKLGIESTVVSLAGPVPVLLRLGATPREEIERVLGLPLVLAKPDDAIASPGQLATHYAPSTPLRLNVHRPEIGDALLAFGKDVPEGALSTINLSPASDLHEAAANLFAALRELDTSGARTIAGLRLMVLSAPSGTSLPKASNASPISGRCTLRRRGVLGA